MAEQNYFEVLNGIDVNGKTKQKNGLTYLSWSWAWAEVKKLHPDANYTIYENKDEWNYFTDGRTCWVKVGVTINGIEHIETLPVMDFRNKSIPLNAVTSFEVNKAIQRAITKACARHGLGLYIYSGEDLPEETDGKNYEQPAPAKQEKKKPAQELAEKANDAGIGEAEKEYKCCDCGKLFTGFTNAQGVKKSAGEQYHISQSYNTDGKARCSTCMDKAGTDKRKAK